MKNKNLSQLLQKTSTFLQADSYLTSSFLSLSSREQFGAQKFKTASNHIYFIVYLPYYVDFDVYCIMHYILSYHVNIFDYHLIYFLFLYRFIPDFLSSAPV